MLVGWPSEQLRLFLLTCVNLPQASLVMGERRTVSQKVKQGGRSTRGASTKASISPTRILNKSDGSFATANYTVDHFKRRERSILVVRVRLIIHVILALSLVIPCQEASQCGRNSLAKPKERDPRSPFTRHTCHRYVIRRKSVSAGN